MNIEEINKRHFIKTDIAQRVNQGLSSQLLRYEHGIIYIEMEVRRKWDKTLDAAAYTIAHSWRDKHIEFEEAVASKIFIIDSRRYNYKRSLMHMGIKPGFDACKGVFFK